MLSIHHRKSQFLAAIFSLVNRYIAVLMAALIAFVFCAPIVAGGEVVEEITDKKGRSLTVVILEVKEKEIRVRRANDSRKFSIPLAKLSDFSREKLKDFNKIDSKNTELGSDNTEEKPSVEVVISNEVLKYFRNQMEYIKESLPSLEDPNSVFTCRQLMQLITLEQDLIAVVSPENPSILIDWPEEITSSRVKRAVGEMRQSIRDAERQRVLKKAGFEIKERDRSSTRQENVVKLRELYESSIKPLGKEINKCNEGIAQEKKWKGVSKQDLITSLEEKGEALEEAITAIHQAFYGFQPGKWMEQEPGWPVDHSAEILRKEISALRKVIHKKLIEAADHSGEMDYRTAEIDGISVYSANFGVILDISGSMTSHIDRLKKDIKKKFQSPVYREVVGCSLKAPALEYGAVAKLKPGTLSCVEEMLLVYKVDTIYWFCDLNDHREEAALYRLAELLRLTGAKFYVRSVGQRPDRDLKAIITDF
ncbi:hypothetical protein BSZ32_04875 [Rubritalea profundi]|uniref:Uncharacterized protein n=2 Tax=Rubritalea profundi TaxID=1658618 RepID=A0A2S7TYR7_9BACT|nr:hypothetical protein BSZ32_04875 [Rubritalea profundi]